MGAAAGRMGATGRSSGWIPAALMGAAGGLWEQPVAPRREVPLTGGQPRLLYHGVTGPQAVVSLSSDASGQHLLLTWRLNGWIDHGRLRPLAP